MAPIVHSICRCRSKTCDEEGYRCQTNKKSNTDMPLMFLEPEPHIKISVSERHKASNAKPVESKNCVHVGSKIILRIKEVEGSTCCCGRHGKPNQDDLKACWRSDKHD